MTRRSPVSSWAPTVVYCCIADKKAHHTAGPHTHTTRSIRMFFLFNRMSFNRKANLERGHTGV